MAGFDRAERGIYLLTDAGRAAPEALAASSRQMSRAPAADAR